MNANVEVFNDILVPAPVVLAAKRNATFKTYVTLTVLVVINLLNYMDRFTIAGVLDDVKNFYDINQSEAGLLQTAFIVSYMCLSPLFGYLGDRYNRKVIIVVGVSVWSATTFCSSFVPSDRFWLFLLLRAIVGVGEASYATVTPTIIADLFAQSKRTTALVCFFFTTPVGSGLGYIVGSTLRNIFHDWRYSLRFTPFMGIICVIVCIFFTFDPIRGAADDAMDVEILPFGESCMMLLKNKSFILNTLGFTAICFVVGSLSWWAVDFINASLDYKNNDAMAHRDYNMALYFGMITCFGGLIGIVIGGVLSKVLKTITHHGDALICSLGLFVAAPILLVSIVMVEFELVLSLILVFLTIVALTVNWALVIDMTLAVVVPNTRATASAFQMLFSHALGDAGSPYLIGMISDRVKGDSVTLYMDFFSLQCALFSNTFVCVIGGAFFLFCSLFIQADKLCVEQTIESARIKKKRLTAGLSTVAYGICEVNDTASSSLDNTEIAPVA